MIRVKMLGSKQMIEALRDKGPRIVASVITRMDSLMLELQAYIVERKLAGQVLNRRSGRLASSVRKMPTKVDGSLITGTVQAGGGVVPYARIHEFGGDIYPTKAKALRFIISGKVIFAQHVRMPERSYMRSSQEEMRQKIVRGIRQAMKEGMES